MRWLPLSLLAFLVVLAPRLAQAQQRSAPLVELDTVETRGDADKSAFGRVMDVMITALVQQHEQRRQAFANKQEVKALEVTNVADVATLLPTPPARPQRAEAPQIEISLGERFALPPPGVATASSDDAASP